MADDLDEFLKAKTKAKPTASTPSELSADDFSQLLNGGTKKKSGFFTRCAKWFTLIKWWFKTFPSFPKATA